MSEIKISDEARECASELLHIVAKNYSPNATRRGIYEYRIQLLLNQRDAELAELRKDKERLDWGQKNFARVALGAPQAEGETWVIFGVADDGSEDVEGNTLREALDAAMSGKGGEK